MLTMKNKMQVLSFTALNLSLEFDKKIIFESSKVYLKTAFDLKDTEIRCTDDAAEKTEEECCFGSSTSLFYDIRNGCQSCAQQYINYFTRK